MDDEPIGNGVVEVKNPVLVLVVMNAVHAGEEAEVVVIIVEFEDEVLLKVCLLRCEHVDGSIRSICWFLESIIKSFHKQQVAVIQIWVLYNETSTSKF